MNKNANPISEMLEETFGKESKEEYNKAQNILFENVEFILIDGKLLNKFNRNSSKPGWLQIIEKKELKYSIFKNKFNKTYKTLIEKIRTGKECLFIYESRATTQKLLKKLSKEFLSTITVMKFFSAQTLSESLRKRSIDC